MHQSSEQPVPLQPVVMRGAARDIADTTPPVLVSGPANGHDVRNNLVLTFNEPVKLGSGTLTLHVYGTGNVYSADVAGNARITVSGNTVTFDPPELLQPKGIYTLIYSTDAIVDLAGNPVSDKGVVAGFTAGISPTPVIATGTAQNDSLHGSDFADTLSGGSGGSDKLYGYGGNDILNGGDEAVRPGMISDELYGGDGDDILNGNGGSDSLRGEDGDDQLFGGADRDFLFGGLGDDLLDGGAGDDSLHDEAGDNVLLGGEGNDFLSSLAGATGTLDGGIGDDTLAGFGGVDFFGGAGSDTIRITLSGADATNGSAKGGAGDDRFELWWNRPADATMTLEGGDGSDTWVIQAFDLAAGASADVFISDFDAGAGGDRIDVRPMLAADYSGNPFVNGHLRLQQQGNDTVLMFDRDGSGAAFGFVTVLTLAGIDAAELVQANFVGGYDPGASAPPVTPTTPELPIAAIGGAGNDTLVGAGGDDRLDGGAGDDVLAGGAGNDVLIGGAGIDSALYKGASGNYTVTRSATGVQVADKRGAAGDGTDQLTGVERLTFSDHHVALDVDGVAGQAYRIYRAAFDRAPDLGGMGFYLSVLDRGVSLFEVAATFVASQEFRDKYGSAPSNADVLTRMYQNVLDREPDRDGYLYWLDVLDTKKASVSAVLASISESVENREAVAELIANGVPFTPWG